MNTRNKLWMAGAAIALVASSPARAADPTASGTATTTHDAAGDAMHQAMMDKATMPMHGAVLPDGTTPGAGPMHRQMGQSGEAAAAQQAAQQHAMQHGMSSTDPTRAAAANSAAMGPGMMEGHGNMGQNQSGTDAAGMMQTAGKHGGMGGTMGGSSGDGRGGGMMGGSTPAPGTGTPGTGTGTPGTGTPGTGGMMGGSSGGTTTGTQK